MADLHNTRIPRGSDPNPDKPSRSHSAVSKVYGNEFERLSGKHSDAVDDALGLYREAIYDGKPIPHGSYKGMMENARKKELADASDMFGVDLYRATPTKAEKAMRGKTPDVWRSPTGYEGVSLPDLYKERDAMVRNSMDTQADRNNINNIGRAIEDEEYRQSHEDNGWGLGNENPFDVLSVQELQYLMNDLQKHVSEWDPDEAEALYNAWHGKLDQLQYVQYDDGTWGWE